MLSALSNTWLDCNHSIFFVILLIWPVTNRKKKKSKVKLSGELIILKADREQKLPWQLHCTLLLPCFLFIYFLHPPPHPKSSKLALKSIFFTPPLLPLSPFLSHDLSLIHPFLPSSLPVVSLHPGVMPPLMPAPRSLQAACPAVRCAVRGRTSSPRRSAARPRWRHPLQMTPHHHQLPHSRTWPGSASVMATAVMDTEEKRGDMCVKNHKERGIHMDRVSKPLK